VSSNTVAGDDSLPERQVARLAGKSDRWCHVLRHVIKVLLVAQQSSCHKISCDTCICENVFISEDQSVSCMLLHYQALINLLQSAEGAAGANKAGDVQKNPLQKPTQLPHTLQRFGCPDFDASCW
jgi:hypothetical protein